MKYVLLGQFSPEWPTRHKERVARAAAKLAQLGITLESAYYTQGPYDFVDVVEAADAEALLAFSIWYASQGFGRIQTMPAFDSATIERAAGRA